MIYRNDIYYISTLNVSLAVGVGSAVTGELALKSRQTSSFDVDRRACTMTAGTESMSSNSSLVTESDPACNFYIMLLEEIMYPERAPPILITPKIEKV